MAHKSSITVVQGAVDPKPQQFRPIIRQLSDGTLVGLFFSTASPSAVALTLRYSVDRITWTTIQSFGVENGTGSFNSNTGSQADVGMVVDAWDNIYVIGGNDLVGGTSWCSKVLTKGAGYSWTLDAKVNGSAQNSVGTQHELIHVNNGGGTGGFGFIVDLYNGSGTPKLAVFDCGAMLTGGGPAFSTITPAATAGFGSGGYQLVQDTLGSDHFMAHFDAATPKMGIMSLNATGTALINDGAYVPTGQGFQLAPVGPDLWARYRAESATTFGVETWNTGGPVLAKVVSAAFANVNNVSTNSKTIWAMYDTGTSKLWIYTYDSTLKTTIRRVGVAVTGGSIVYDAASVSDDTGVGASTNSTIGGLTNVRLSAKSDYFVTNTTTLLAYINYTPFNSPPNAPALTAPANGIAADLAAGYTFAWTFNDPNAGDTQTAWALRRKIGAGAYEYWNDGTAAWGVGIVWNASAAGSKTFGAGKWTNGNTYQWSVATQDNSGAQGAFAADLTVIASTAPVDTITGPATPVTNTTLPVITWSIADAEADPQVTYQIKIESGAYGAAPGAGTPVWDSGEVIDTVTRARQVPVALVNGTTYRIFMRTSQVGSLYSAWATRDILMSLDPPAIPTLAVTPDAANARVTLVATKRENLLTATESDFEVNLGRFNSGGANTNIAVSAAQANHGTKSMSLTKTTALGTAYAYLLPVDIPAVPGRQYTARASYRANTNARNVQTNLDFYNAAGVLLQRFSSPGTTPDSNAGWVDDSISGVAPALTAFVAMNVSVLAVPNGEVHYVDSVSISPGASAVWTIGGLDALALTAQFQFSDDGGATWLDVRNGIVNYDPVTIQAQVIDYEVPLNKQRVYRALTRVEV